MLKERLKSNQAVYHLNKTKVIFGFNDRGPSMTGASVRTVEDVFELTRDEDEIPTKKKRGSHKGAQKERV